jgi:hypothetical protein
LKKKHSKNFNISENNITHVEAAKVVIRYDNQILNSQAFSKVVITHGPSGLGLNAMAHNMCINEELI